MTEQTTLNENISENDNRVQVLIAVGGVLMTFQRFFLFILQKKKMRSIIMSMAACFWENLSKAGSVQDKKG